MNQIHLRGTPIITSALGFGCVSLTMHDNTDHAVALLEEVFALGITHFDTARLYGFGQSESILGRFLKAKRDRVTVTTKYGMQASAALSKHRRLVGLARKMSHRFKFIGKLARRANANVQPSRAYGPQEAAASLDTSLKELQTDYVDIFELHEGPPDEARRDDLIDHLNSEVKKGRIRCYGIGTGYAHLLGDADTFPRQYSVLQFDSNAFNRNVELLRNADDRGLITFGALSPAKMLADALRQDRAVAAQWSHRLGLDLTDQSAIHGLLLRQAGLANPQGITLFSTTRHEHLRSNLKFYDRCNAPADEINAFASFAPKDQAGAHDR